MASVWERKRKREGGKEEEKTELKEVAMLKYRKEGECERKGRTC